MDPNRAGVDISTKGCLKRAGIATMVDFSGSFTFNVRCGKCKGSTCMTMGRESTIRVDYPTGKKVRICTGLIRDLYLIMPQCIELEKES